MFFIIRDFSQVMLQNKNDEFCHAIAVVNYLNLLFQAISV
jgi:hypothetical protein